VLWLRQDLGSAADALRRALTLAPQGVSARYHLAMVLLTRGEQEEAVKELESILALEPGHIGAQLDLAVLAVSQGNPTGALNRLEVVLHSDPENPRALFYRAVALDHLQRKDEATEILQNLAGAGKGKYSERAQRYLEERNGPVS